MQKPKKYRITEKVLLAAKNGCRLSQNEIYYAFKSRFVSTRTFPHIDAHAYNVVLERIFKQLMNGSLKVDRPGEIYYYILTAMENYKPYKRQIYFHSTNFADLTYQDGDPFIPADNIQQDPLWDKIKYVLSRIDIDKDHKRMFEMKYFEGYYLREIGDTYGYTRERIRQFLVEVTKKIKKFIEKNQI